MLNLQALYKNLANLSPRERMVFNLAVLFVSLTFLDRLVVSPVFLRIKTLNQEMRDEETLIKKNLHMLSQKEAIMAESGKLQSYFSTFKSEDEEATALLKELEDLANKNSAYLIDMKPGGLKDVDGTKKYIITLSLEAQMEQLAAFMYGVESSDRLFTIEKYQIEPKSRESSVARCSMVISKVALS